MHTVMNRSITKTFTSQGKSNVEKRKSMLIQLDAHHGRYNFPIFTRMKINITLNNILFIASLKMQQQQHNDVMHSLV